MMKYWLVSSVLLVAAAGGLAHCGPGTPQCSPNCTYSQVLQSCVCARPSDGGDVVGEGGDAPGDVVRPADEGALDAIDAHEDAPVALDTPVTTDVMADASGDASVDVVVNPGLPAPTQMAPLSTAYVTSTTPTLHWALVTGIDGAAVDVCKDRAFSQQCQTLRATGTSARVGSALAAGVWFWRARGRMGAVEGSQESATWEFFAPARTADSADTSWGTMLDIDGDGLADVAVGAPNANASAGTTPVGNGYVYLYYGTAGTLPATPSVTLAQPAGADGTFGYSVASAGDVNGDGFADLVVGAPGATRAYVYFGGARATFSRQPGVTLTEPGSSGQESTFGFSVGSGGDLNGDGFSDVFVGDVGGAHSFGSAYIFPGGAHTVAATPIVSVNDPCGASLAAAENCCGVGSDFGSSAASADFNGDGAADLVVASGYSTQLYYGVPGTALTTTNPVTLPGTWAVGGGDFNDDGYADIVMDGRLFVGSRTAISGAASATLPAPRLFSALGFAGDVNGDGFWDFDLYRRWLRLCLSRSPHPVWSDFADRGAHRVWCGGIRELGCGSRGR